MPLMNSAGVFTRGLEVVGNTAELASILFMEYLSGPCCGSDAAHSVLMASSSFLLNGCHLASAVRLSSHIIAQKMFCRLVESCVLATLLQSRVEFFRNAGTHHLLFFYVQEYFFARSWITRFFRAGGQFLLARVLPVYFGSPKSLQPHNPEDPLEGLPQTTRDALRFFHHSYKLDIPYAIVACGFVSDVTHTLLQQMDWLAAFYASRGAPTSRWRMLKPYICNAARSTIETCILYTARVAGAFLGRAVSCDALPSAGVFWGERLAVLAAIPIARLTACRVASVIATRLEAAHPATPDDEREDSRQQAAREEATGTVEQWEAPRADLYAILGVDERASAADIRRAYRKAALECHPDRVMSNTALQEAARERMVALNQAYETLNSETRRSQYDASRTDSVLVNSLQTIDRLSPVSVVALWVLGCVGLSCTTVTFLYTQYMTAFYHLTTPGVGPLRFIVSM